MWANLVIIRKESIVAAPVTAPVALRMGGSNSELRLVASIIDLSIFETRDAIYDTMIEGVSCTEGHLSRGV